MIKLNGFQKIITCLLIGCVFYTLSCATQEKTQGLQDYDEGSEASGHAYISDAMTLRESMPYRPEWKPIPFFYKRCEEVGQRHPWTATYYECTLP